MVSKVGASGVRYDWRTMTENMSSEIVIMGTLLIKETQNVSYNRSVVKSADMFQKAHEYMPVIKDSFILSVF